ncbi:MAG TPA: CoA pyrophosphatase [Acidimicrobiia bacterium]|nr:CoA pyrophosphatase [Acidimicrobiia bacterium]
MWDFDLAPDPPPPGDLDRAAVLIAVYDDPDGLTRLILTKRPDTMPTHAGHIAFPGGRPDPSDAGPTATALREANEEVGIHPDDVEVLGFLPPIDTVQFRLMVVPVVGRLAQPPRLVPSAREVVKVYHPTLEELADESLWNSEDWNGHTVWFYDLEGDSLWGATAMMTRRLLGLGSY